MNFQDLLSFWGKRDALKETVDMFLGMLERTSWMYDTAVQLLWSDEKARGRRKAIRRADVQVNKLERTIRKKIVLHLSLNPNPDTNYCLVLMSVVKDAERVGDYCKNIVEVRDYHRPWDDDHDLVQDFTEIRDLVAEMFSEIGDTFKESDEERARALIETSSDLGKRCDDLIGRLLELDGFTTGQAVCYTLLARYFKRIAAHLGNIATSVVMPIHKLDYYDEDWDQQLKAEDEDDDTDEDLNGDADGGTDAADGASNQVPGDA
jgi:phosphate uptake regulator